MNSSSVRNAVLWLVILCLVVLVFYAFRNSKTPGLTPQFSELVNDVNAGKVESAKINSVTGDVEGERRARRRRDSG